MGSLSVLVVFSLSQSCFQAGFRGQITSLAVRHRPFFMLRLRADCKLRTFKRGKAARICTLSSPSGAKSPIQWLKGGQRAAGIAHNRFWCWETPTNRIFLTPAAFQPLFQSICKCFGHDHSSAAAFQVGNLSFKLMASISANSVVFARVVSKVRKMLNRIFWVLIQVMRI